MTGRRVLPKRIALVDKPGAFKKEDVQCPICWSILFEPVALPCTHALCYNCFTKHVKETSLQCPCCRMRLSVWSRQAFRENNLIDKRLWERIQKEFPKLVETRRLGNESSDLSQDAFVSTIENNRQNLTDDEEDDEFVERATRPLVRKDAERGEIKRELEEALKKHEEDIENRRASEEKESQELILKLQAEQEIAPPQQDLDADFNFAKKLEEEERLAVREAINAKRKLFTGSPLKLPERGCKLSSKIPTVNKKRLSSSSVRSRHYQHKRLKNGRLSSSPTSSKNPFVDAGKSQNIQEQENSQRQVIEDDIALLINEEKKEAPLSQNSHMEINRELMIQQRLGLKELQKRLVLHIQEAEDRKLAEKLNKELNKPPGREDGYRNSLRSWLNKGNNAPTSATSDSACMTTSSATRRSARSSTVTSRSADVVDVLRTIEEED